MNYGGHQLIYEGCELNYGGHQPTYEGRNLHYWQSKMYYDTIKLNYGGCQLIYGSSKLKYGSFLLTEVGINPMGGGGHSKGGREGLTQGVMKMNHRSFELFCGGEQVKCGTCILQ